MNDCRQIRIILGSPTVTHNVTSQGVDPWVLVGMFSPVEGKARLYGKTIRLQLMLRLLPSLSALILVIEPVLRKSIPIFGPNILKTEFLPLTGRFNSCDLTR